MAPPSNSSQPKSSSVEFKLTRSRLFALAAVVVWGISLCFPGIVTYGRVYYGWLILLLGWVGFNFAWLANIFFLFAVARILLSPSGIPVVATLTSVTMAFDTFRLVGKMHGESWGNYGYVFGYGVGAVLWFVSLALLWMATAQKAIETFPVGQSSPRYLAVFRAGGLGFLILVVLVSGILAIKDRQEARPFERRFLDVAVFKRKAVCRAPDLLPLSPPVVLRGPLEVTGNGEQSWQSFWASPQDFLKWGASTVRVGKIDYVLVDSAEGKKVVAQEAKGPAAAKVDVTVLPHRSIDLELSASSRRLLHHHWDLDSDSGIPCPEIDPINLPRKLILDSLSLHEPSPVAASSSK